MWGSYLVPKKAHHKFSTFWPSSQNKPPQSFCLIRSHCLISFDFCLLHAWYHVIMWAPWLMCASWFAWHSPHRGAILWISQRILRRPRVFELMQHRAEQQCVFISVFQEIMGFLPQWNMGDVELGLWLVLIQRMSIPYTRIKQEHIWFESSNMNYRVIEIDLIWIACRARRSSGC